MRIENVTIRILGDLRRTFPNVQFVVSTHSPQVLSTVPAGQIIELERDGDRIEPGHPDGPTFGAAAGDVLSAVMGVEQRPKNEFREKLAAYWRLIDDRQGETDEARELRAKLDELFRVRLRHPPVVLVHVEKRFARGKPAGGGCLAAGSRALDHDRPCSLQAIGEFGIGDAWPVTG